MKVGSQLPGEPVTETQAVALTEWTIRVYRDGSEAAMTYYVYSAEALKRLVLEKLAGWSHRKVEIIGP